MDEQGFRAGLKKRADEGYEKIRNASLELSFEEVISHLNSLDEFIPPAISEICFDKDFSKIGTYEAIKCFFAVNGIENFNHSFLGGTQNTQMLLASDSDGNKSAVRISYADWGFNSIIRANHPAMLQAYDQIIIEPDDGSRPMTIEILPPVVMLFEKNTSKKDSVINMARGAMPNGEGSDNFIKDVGILPNGEGLVFVDPDSLPTNRTFSEHEYGRDLYIGSDGAWLQHKHFNNCSPEYKNIKVVNIASPHTDMDFDL